MNYLIGLLLLGCETKVTSSVEKDTYVETVEDTAVEEVVEETEEQENTENENHENLKNIETNRLTSIKKLCFQRSYAFLDVTIEFSMKNYPIQTYYQPCTTENGHVDSCTCTEICVPTDSKTRRL